MKVSGMRGGFRYKMYKDQDFWNCSSNLEDYGQGKIERDDVATICIDTCVDLKLYSDRVCKLAVATFKEWVLTVADLAFLSPAYICGTLFGDSCAHAYDPSIMWNISIAGNKPPVVPPKTPKKGSPMLRILHISDIHVDPLYMEGSDAECGEPLCCRSNDNPAPTEARKAGKWGDIRNCDTPFRTLESMFQHIATTHKFDYIVWTGDLPPHNVWNQTRNDQLSQIKNLTAMLNIYFPGKAIFPAVGNHESVPVNSFPQPSITGSQNIKWLYTALADSWTHWLPESSRNTIEYGGYYSVLVRAGFRMIGLNMNYCDSANWWLLINATDPAGQLQWLSNELKIAEDNSEKVHILGHQPPSSCLKAWSWNYYKLVTRFENTIAGQFFGHTHNDEFKVFYDADTLSRPVGVLYVPGSVTPTGGRFPAYRLYEIDGFYTGSSWMVQDHWTYMLNLTEANNSPWVGPQDHPLWKLEYAAKATYGLDNLFPESWDKLITRFEKDDKLFQKYNRQFSRANSGGICEQTCKRNMICNMRSARSYDPALCNDILPGAAYNEYIQFKNDIIAC
ncbi:unnamed protein product [Owenia fusiformis]|uniref:Sphingomyelin phosphodiesterase n=1 Tax=Owenia fusiformis TaxID=6347 RepID=A0A8S4Q8V9_OWEFU|nr:unnamed protein product [Owenia fusiformis]